MIQDLKSPVSYRTLLFLGTFLSGFASLVYQVVWQKYLAIIVGSEAKSTCIVVSIFLVGLAVGYYVFGRLMEKKWSRKLSLKVYGYVELGIAIYALVFPFLFVGFKTLSFQGPSHFVFDIIIVTLSIFLPTALMGASIPVLTTVMPENSKEVNTIDDDDNDDDNNHSDNIHGGYKIDLQNHSARILGPTDALCRSWTTIRENTSTPPPRLNPMLLYTRSSNVQFPFATVPNETIATNKPNSMQRLCSVHDHRHCITQTAVMFQFHVYRRRNDSLLIFILVHFDPFPRGGSTCVIRQ